MISQIGEELLQHPQWLYYKSNGSAEFSMNAKNYTDLKKPPDATWRLFYICYFMQMYGTSLNWRMFSCSTL